MPEPVSTIDAVLIPPGTVISQKGDSLEVDITTAEYRVFLLSLQISAAVEQEYLEVEIYGSRDGATWDTHPLATLPQRFYPGHYASMIDLAGDRSIRFLRMHWEVSRWGRGDLKPHFVCSFTMREVSPELLVEARAEELPRR